MCTLTKFWNVLTLNDLRDGCPVDICLSQLLQSAPENSVFIGGAGGVFLNDGLSGLSGQLYELSVACNVGNFQIKGHAALLGALQIARPAQLQIGLGNAEPVVGITHDVDALTGVLAKLIWGDEDTETLVGTTTHTSAELVQLGKAETLGFEDDHYGGVGHVDTYLNDGGGNEYLCLATDKLLHLGFLVGRLHLAMNLAEAELREYLGECGKAVFQVFEVYLLTLLDEGEDDIYLTSLIYLVADAVVE